MRISYYRKPVPKIELLQRVAERLKRLFADFESNIPMIRPNRQGARR
jgi:hypothetical protein